jgi:uncharacterized protein YdiU (UPF0061 family)
MSFSTSLADPTRDIGPAIGQFTNTYAQLPPRFFAPQRPAQAASPRLVRLNRPLAAQLGLDLDAIDAADPAAIFSGNVIPAGAEPIACAYAGHQFGGFSPQLGDGRAILLGEMIGADGGRRDIQLKGSGRTPFSRGGDGRAALGPVLREYLVSEAMHALGIPTTRALAAVTTGETVYRDRPLPGAVFTRVAASHIRVGTFQYFAARRDDDAVRILADMVIARHYPGAAGAAGATGAANPALALLEGVIARQAALIARWMQVGFIHGVMNTDNMTVSGETIDYGPCAFMDSFDPATVFSAIDEGGRYAYANQPRIAQWNLARLAETLLPLLDPVPERAVSLATEALSQFSVLFDTFSLAAMRAKIGLCTEEAGDRALIAGLLDWMQAQAADFTNTFRALGDAVDSPESPVALPGGAAWMAQWRQRGSREPHAPAARAAAMRQVNPAFIPRNHRVEQALNAAIEHADFSVFDSLLQVVSRPFESQPENAAYASAPLQEERVLQTFCGT